MKSGYWMMNNEKHSALIREAETLPSLNLLKDSIWKVKTAPKIKNFMWRAIFDAIPVGDLLIKKGVKLDLCCQLCGFEGGSVNHLLFTCPIARQVWALSLIHVPENGFDMNSFYCNIHFLMFGLNDGILRLRQEEGFLGLYGICGRIEISLGLKERYSSL